MGYKVCIKAHSQAAYCLSNIKVEEGQSLLAASECTRLQPIMAGCRGGGCGACRIRILSGRYRQKPMSKTHINEQDLAQGVVLACRIFPESDMEIIAERPVAFYNPFQKCPLQNQTDCIEASTDNNHKPE